MISKFCDTCEHHETTPKRKCRKTGDALNEYVWGCQPHWEPKKEAEQPKEGRR